MLGRVKIIMPSDYGFITDEDGLDYFFHQSWYKGDWDTLRQISPPKTSKGPLVQFNSVEHERGRRAKDVEYLGEL